MKLHRLAPLLPLVACTALASEASLPQVVKASPQSVECFYQPEGENPTRCRVRLHLTPAEGYSIQMTAPELPLVGRDGKGNLMFGVFREWEICFGDVKNTNCVIAVYDFRAMPKGGQIRFGTRVDIPVTCGEQQHKDVQFSPTESGTLSVNGIDFHITPSDGNDADPDNTAFTVEYDSAKKANLAGITICESKGKPLPVNIVEGVYHENEKKVRATYVLSSKHSSLLFRLATYKPVGSAEVLVKFSARIGR